MASTKRAFSLIELLVVIGIIAVLLSLLLPAVAKARRSARTAVCMANLHGLSVGMANYASDAKDNIGTFSWTSQTRISAYSDLNSYPANSAPAPHCAQAIDLLRRRLGRDQTSQPAFFDRYVARNYSYLVLVDGGYFGDILPDPGVICPEDRNVLEWARLVHAPDKLQKLQNMPETSESPQAYKLFAPFWSSYQLVPYAWATEDSGISQFSSLTRGSHHLYNAAALGKIGPRRLDEVSFAGQKVLAFDLFDRHSASKDIFHAYPIARQPLMFFDGQVTIRKTGDANPGWDPTRTNSTFTTKYFYTPIPGEPAPLRPLTSQDGTQQMEKLLAGYYRWTRNGLHGVDYGGKP